MQPARVALASLAAGLAALAVMEGLAPQSLPAVLLPPALPRGIAMTQPIDATGLIATIAARPLFRPDRRPVAQMSQSDGTLPRLSGILFSRTIHVAIFTPDTGPTRLVALGGRVGAYRLTAITASHVTLTGLGVVLVLKPRFAGTASAAGPSTAPQRSFVRPSIQTPGRD